MAVGLSEESLRPYLKEIRNVVVGCINSPRSVTATGEDKQIDRLKSLLDKDSVFCRKLHVNIAYHSPQMSELAAEYLELLGDLGCEGDSRAACTVISTVTGKAISQSKAQQSQYWVDNMVSQVKFSPALGQICSANKQRSGNKLGADRSIGQVTDLLEVGPHSALQGPIKDILSTGSNDNVSYCSVLRRSIPAMETLLDAIGRLYCFGYPVDVGAVNQHGLKPWEKNMALPTLPEYPFDHSQDYWHESRLSKEGYRLRKHPRLDLLGNRVPDWNDLDARWRRYIRTSEMPWVEDHKVCQRVFESRKSLICLQIDGTMVYPAAGMLVMALEAMKQMVDDSHTIAGYTIEDVTFDKPLTVASDSKGTETQIYLRPVGGSYNKERCSEFSICINNGDRWDETCRGTIKVEFESPITEVDAGKESQARLCHYRQIFEEGVHRCERAVDSEYMYEYMKSIGLDYGFSFRALQQLHYSEHGIAHGRVQVYQWSTQSTAQHPQPHIIHPTTLDALFQLMLVALSKGTEERLPTIMPTRISKLWIAGHGVSHPYIGAVKANAQATFSGRRKASGSMFALDETTNELLVSLEMTEVTTLTIRENFTKPPKSKGRLCYSLSWKPDIGLLSDRQLSEYCERTRPDRVSDAEFYEDLGFVLLKFMSDALDAIFAGNSLTPDSHLHKYVGWAKFQVERFHDGVLPNLSNRSSKWTLLSRDSRYRKKLTEQLESTNQGKFFVSLGRQLPQILQGLLDPLPYMFQDDSVPNFYREINNKVICYEPFNQYLDLMCHKHPGIKVLEIGAGTGATTAFILSALSSHRENGLRALDCNLYDYTDISPAFFETAAGDYQEHSSRMRFKVLDIEADPAIQGFDLGTYDLIVAASVGLPHYLLTLARYTPTNNTCNRCFTLPRIWRRRCVILVRFSNRKSHSRPNPRRCLEGNPDAL